jgi:colanic acid biosynthesis glycosyl transferase WcaI
MNNKRILIISQHFPPEESGNASRVYDMSKNLVEFGSHVTVYSPFPSFPHGSFPKVNKLRMNRNIDGIHHYKTWNWQPDAKDPRFISRIAYYLIFPLLSTIRALLNSKHYDVIITTAPPIFTGIPGYFVKKITRKKWLLDVRDLWIDASVALNFIKKKGILYRAAQLYEKICYGTCDQILVTTEKVEEAIRNTYGVPNDRIHIVPNGVDTTIYRPSQQKKNQLIYTGNIGYAQDLETVILSIKKINEQTKNKPFDFYLVGDGDIKRNLEAFTKKNHVDDHVFFTGLVHRERIPGLIGESLIGVAPLKNLESLEYAIPTKCYEYMGCGVPFLGTGRGEIEKLAIESHAGLIAKNDVDSICEKICYLLDHPEEREEMGRQGRNFVEKYYDRKLITKHLLDIISS